MTWTPLAALSRLVSIGALLGALLLLVGTVPLGQAGDWVSGHLVGLRTDLAGFNTVAEKNLAALRSGLFERGAPGHPSETERASPADNDRAVSDPDRLPGARANRKEEASWKKPDPDPSGPPIAELSPLLGAYPETLWSPPVLPWSSFEIAAAHKRCMTSLSTIAADIEPLPPIRAGACGMPAPVKLRGLGREPEVTLNPPVVVNCAMVAALDRWIEEAVQPAARTAFGKPVTEIVGSSYACRNIYGRDNDRLSQHAFGNAFDLPTFVLSNGRRVHVVLGWGPTMRDGKPKLVPIVAKVEPETATPETDQQNKPEQEIATPKTDTAEAKFLRRVHKEACSVFSTVLGPELDATHRDHFHLDLQDRGVRSVCR